MAIDTIKQHPTSDMLINYAMGNSSEAESLIISAHLSYCSECRRDVYEYEKLAGDFLFEHDKVELSSKLYTNVLEAIDKQEQTEKKINYVDHKITSNLDERGIRIPSFVSKYLNTKLDTSNWNTALNLSLIHI